MDGEEKSEQGDELDEFIQTGRTGRRNAVAEVQSETEEGKEEGKATTGLEKKMEDIKIDEGKEEKAS